MTIERVWYVSFMIDYYSLSHLISVFFFAALVRFERLGLRCVLFQALLQLYNVFNFTDVSVSTRAWDLTQQSSKPTMFVRRSTMQYSAFRIWPDSTLPTMLASTVPVKMLPQLLLSHGNTSQGKPWRERMHTHTPPSCPRWHTPQEETQRTPNLRRVSTVT